MRLGFVPLFDAAPLLVADALGLFETVGLRVALSPEGSWASIRDKLAFSALDGAHLLSPMPIALAAGFVVNLAVLVVIGLLWRIAVHLRR
jgi:ABC-type nitrate/sulfonate/bicarbonate transport system substrate-binding protein